LIFPGEQRSAVEKSQHLAEGSRFHLPYGINGLADVINPNVIDSLGDQSFVKDLETAPLPQNRFEQWTVHEFHVSIPRQAKDSQII
jgi:hypothetical protein